MEPNKALVKDAKAEDVDVHLYRLMIGSLMYLIASRPDITFAICVYARFQVTPKTSHLYVVKRIFKYLKGQPKLGIWYLRDLPFDLEAYSDSDYAGASLIGNPQQEVLWTQNQMLDYGFNLMNTKIYIDNKSTICIVKNPVFHSKTKHIEIMHHFIRDSYKKKLIQAYLISKSGSQFKMMIAKDGRCFMDIFVVKTGISSLNTTGQRLTNLVADKTVYKEWEDIVKRVATTASSLEAKQDSEAQTGFEVASKQSNDPPLSRGHTLRSGEDTIKLK
nr:hypothetical protein [Tanacetum cinerariifolium]